MNAIIGNFNLGYGYFKQMREKNTNMSIQTL